MAVFYDRVYPNTLPAYSTSNIVTDKNIITATIRSLMEKIESTSKQNGKFFDIRELFEFQLKIEEFFRRHRKYRNIVMDKCTELIEGVLIEHRLHPKDKKGLIILFSTVMRMCMKIDD